MWTTHLPLLTSPSGCQTKLDYSQLQMKLHVGKNRVLRNDLDSRVFSHNQPGRAFLLVFE